MNILKVFTGDIANGEGIRVSVWVAGCSKGCSGCHNKNTWKENQGIPLTEELIDKILNCCDKPHIAGLTITGGNPFDIKLKHGDDCAHLAKRFKERFPNKTVWAWTGEKMEDIEPSLLENIDVLVDGMYLEEEKDISLVYAGSRNQRVIRLK